MDKEIHIYGYELTNHEITMNRLIKLMDKQGKTLLHVPLDLFVVRTFFRSLNQTDPVSLPAHKMFLDAIEGLGGKLQRAVIDGLQKGMFYATLYFSKAGGGEITVHAEAGDAIALAFRSPCYLYVKESTLYASKHDVANRVRWYDPDDPDVLNQVQDLTHDELRLHPESDLNQLIDMAVKAEDYPLAAKLKKALQSKR
jgi:bifunctional DNase/RNase